MYNDSDYKKWDDLHEEIQTLWDMHRDPRCTERMRARQVNKIMQMEIALLKEYGEIVLTPRMRQYLPEIQKNQNLLKIAE